MQTFFLVLETIGVISFAVAGSIAAIDKEIDLFGVLLLSLVTSFGGGIMRDVLIGNYPAFFTSYFHILCGAVTALAVFLTAAVLKNKYAESEKVVDTVNNYFDAVGLGIFSVMGARICIVSGYSSALVTISLGMITGVGGGMIRDVCLREIPFVLKKHVYAVAAIAGASLYYILYSFSSIPEEISMLIGVAAVFLIRVVSTALRLNVPKAIIFEKMANKNESKKTKEEAIL